MLFAATETYTEVTEMKRKAGLIAVMLILALSCALVLNGCRLNIDLVRATPESSGNAGDNKTPGSDATPDAGATDGPGYATPDPADPGDALVLALAFANTFKGTWTADDNTFLDFDVEDDKPFVLSGVWASDGAFPVYDIIEAKTNPGTEKKYQVKLRERVSGKESELIIVSDNNSIIVSETGSIIGEKRYTYDGTKQFPPEVISFSPEQIVAQFGGHWTGYKDPDEFVVIEAGPDGEALLRHGYRSAPGEAVEYTFKSAVVIDKLGYDYDVVLVNRQNGQELSTQAGIRQAGNILLFNFVDGRGSVSFEAYSETKLTDVDPVVFATQYKGAWTNSDNEFIQYSVSDGKAHMMFAIWNSGGDFPAGQITRVTQIGGEKKYEISLKMHGDGSVHVYFMEMDDSTGKMTVWEDGHASSDYYFIASQQPAEPLSDNEILSNFGGLWISNDNLYEFIYIEKLNSDSINVTYGIRNSDGEFHYETIENAIGDDLGHDFQVTFKKAGSSEIIVRYVGLIQAGKTMLIDLNDGKGERSFLLSEHDAILEVGEAYLAGQLVGCWTASNMSDFISFSKSATIMFAVWNSGGEFPVGNIKRVTTFLGGSNEGIYMLVLRMKGTNELKVYNLKIISQTQFEFWEEGGVHDTYTYYTDKQLGMG